MSTAPRELISNRVCLCLVPGFRPSPGGDGPWDASCVIRCACVRTVGHGVLCMLQNNMNDKTVFLPPARGGPRLRAISPSMAPHGVAGMAPTTRRLRCISCRVAADSRGACARPLCGDPRRGYAPLVGRARAGGARPAPGGAIPTKCARTRARAAWGAVRDKNRYSASLSSKRVSHVAGGRARTPPHAVAKRTCRVLERPPLAWRWTRPSDKFTTMATVSMLLT